MRWDVVYHPPDGPLHQVVTKAPQVTRRLSSRRAFKEQSSATTSNTPTPKEVARTWIDQMMESRSSKVSSDNNHY